MISSSVSSSEIGGPEAVRSISMGISCNDELSLSDPLKLFCPLMRKLLPYQSCHRTSSYPILSRYHMNWAKPKKARESEFWNKTIEQLLLKRIYFFLLKDNRRKGTTDRQRINDECWRQLVGMCWKLCLEEDWQTHWMHLNSRWVAENTNTCREHNNNEEVLNKSAQRALFHILFADAYSLNAVSLREHSQPFYLLSLWLPTLFPVVFLCAIGNIFLYRTEFSLLIILVEKGKNKKRGIRWLSD